MRNAPLVLASFAAALVLAPSLVAQTDTTSAAPPGQHAAPRPHTNPNLITAEEIAAHPARNLYELVRSIRPAWLRGITASVTYGSQSDPNIPDIYARMLVMQDGLRLGEFDELRRIPVETVAEVRYLDGREAVARFGPSFGKGAILVTSK
ncbi:MAG TPA: TonB-dependent receptor plug domain-containing protein [Longimicrobiaceae bacterium]|nr:TonB-dependent receptor plug domain-containing protein [Longimicrobiaceae bacterium]